ncbi:MAG TPA: hypothetical protein VEW48_01595 [Thermoanaerobaculia bacterium]|nr:hypothetical protein [Thermoanaerobaculia bacterium]
MHAPSPSTLFILILLPLLAWRVYMRFRRMVGRQRLSKARPWITLGIFSTVIVVLMVFAAQGHTQSLWGIAAGLPVGAGLALYGLRITRFEPTPQGLFYTPNAYLGIAMSLLFFGRILYRLVEVYQITAAHARPDFMKSPLTLSVFGLIAGYYTVYAIGLLLWRNRVEASSRSLETSMGEPI